MDRGSDQIRVTQTASQRDHVCAVDVGTRSARAAVFTPDGQMRARAVAPFAVSAVDGVTGTMRSTDIEAALRASIRSAVARAGIAPDRIGALCVDATCSLVLRDASGAGLPLDDSGQDVLAWFDQRASAESVAATQTGHPLIARQGGTMWPEMQLPKLMWLRRNRPDLWARMGRAMDLSDDLAAGLTGRPVRSLCTTVAKWPWVEGWPADLFDALDIADLPQRAGLSAPRPVGEVIGPLSAAAAQDLGLPRDTLVATGMVDAFAGVLGAAALSGKASDRAMGVLVAGTSASIMTLGPRPVAQDGIWGPYPAAITRDQYISEGGLTAAGGLLDHVIASWPLASGTRPDHATVLARIEALLAQHGPALGAGLHVLPDFAGNRAPFTDPFARGVISGLSLDRSLDGLCRLFWRASLAIALGLRQVLDRMQPQVDHLVMVGGMTQSRVLAQLFCDALGLPLMIYPKADAVLTGTAMAAFRALGHAPDIHATPDRLTPRPDWQAALAREGRVFALMQRHRAALLAQG